MAKFPIEQVIPKQGNKKNLKAKKEETPRHKTSDPTFKTNQGDLGIQRTDNPNIPRMVKAPTRTGDSISNHVGKVGSVMKRAGMLT